MEKNIKTEKYTFPLGLFISLMALALVSYFYEIIRTNLIANIPSTDGLSISGHIEWFDLINETIQAFLIVPLYAILNKVVNNEKKFEEQIWQTFIISFVLYTVFSLIVLMRCQSIVAMMTNSNIQETTTYLRLETIGFIIGNVVSFISVLFIILGKTKCIYLQLAIKTGCTIIGDLALIPQFGVNGVAYSNILVNSMIVVLFVCLLKRERLIVKPNVRFDKTMLKDYCKIGLFSGGQIFLDNIIYAVLVCKMVNQLAEQGNYWVANSFIWGFLLIPISALSEITKKDCRNEITKDHMKFYFVVDGFTFVFWLAMIPLLNVFLGKVLGIADFVSIKAIILTLIPFYVAYAICQILDSIFTGQGKTYFLFIISIIVNCVYYPIVYVLLNRGLFTMSMRFICCMFGFGMVCHLVCSIIFCKQENKKYIIVKNKKTRSGDKAISPDLIFILFIKGVKDNSFNAN